MKLVAGLGNPESRYAGTRHNVGFMVAQHLADTTGIALKRQGHQGIYGVGRIAGQEVTILLPQTYMNRSGASVGSACKSLGVAPGDLIVVHDDIDIPYGQLRIRTGGGHGGHNGIRSIREVLGTAEFVRLKFGVGRPPGAQEVADFVLSNFSGEEKKSLGPLIADAGEAIATILTVGVAQAMNKYNPRSTSS